MSRKNYGNCALRGVDSVNLNTCGLCGTNNPTLPGAGLPERCAGCGDEMPRSTLTVNANRFTPPQKLKDPDANEDGVKRRTQRRRHDVTRKLARSLRIRIENHRGSTN